LEAVDRADLGEQLRSGECAAARQLEQRRRDRYRPLFELAIELGDRARERAAARDEFACEPHLQLLVAPGEPAARALEVERPVEPSQRHLEGRVELMQVPTQPLLGSAPFVDDVIPMVDQQLQITKDSLLRTRATQVGLPQGCPRDSERVDRVRLAARAPGTPLGCHQLRRHPHQILTLAEQLPFEPARQLPAILERPQPLSRKRSRPPHQLIAPDRDGRLVEHPARVINRDSRHRLLVHVHSDHYHLSRLQ